MVCKLIPEQKESTLFTGTRLRRLVTRLAKQLDGELLSLQSSTAHTPVAIWHVGPSTCLRIGVAVMNISRRDVGNMTGESSRHYLFVEKIPLNQKAAMGCQVVESIDPEAVAYVIGPLERDHLRLHRQPSSLDLWLGSSGKTTLRKIAHHARGAVLAA